MKKHELTGVVLGALLAACGPVDDGLDPEQGEDDVEARSTAIEGPLPVLGLGPLIYDMKTTRVSPNQIRLSWKTDRSARSSVSYDLSTWRKTTRDAAAKRSHSVLLSNLISGSPHRYQITVVDEKRRETIDWERTVSTASYARGALPDGWRSRDIGAARTAAPGSAWYDKNVAGGAFVVRGTGTDVYNDSDSFHFVYMPIDGDFELTLKVESWNGFLHMWTKAMTMFRADLTPGSMMVNQSLNYSGLDYLYYRDVAGAQHTDVAAAQLNSSVGAPVWARLRRVGDRFTESYSLDGVTWSVHGPAEGLVVPLPRAGYVGFGTCSKSDVQMSEIIYSNVSLRAL